MHLCKCRDEAKPASNAVGSQIQSLFSSTAPNIPTDSNILMEQWGILGKPSQVILKEFAV